MRDNGDVEPSYSIRAVVEQTGLSAHTIRAWERRYGVPEPVRTETNRRVYRERDVLRLKLLQRAVSAGHSIGMIAGLAPEDLERMLGAGVGEARDIRKPASILGECRIAMRNLDSALLESVLSRASAVLGIDAWVADIVIPLLHELDQGWEQGTLRIAHEHMVSAVLRAQLERVRRSLSVPASAPRMVVTTPSGQLHELGALLVAITGVREGWAVTYLGPNLPFDEIAMAAKRIDASAVALSVVFPEGDPAVDHELRSLRAALAPNVALLVGGRAVPSYAEVLTEVEASVATDLEALRAELSRSRLPGRK